MTLVLDSIRQHILSLAGIGTRVSCSSASPSERTKKSQPEERNLLLRNLKQPPLSRKTLLSKQGASCRGHRTKNVRNAGTRSKREKPRQFWPAEIWVQIPTARKAGHRTLLPSRISGQTNIISLLKANCRQKMVFILPKSSEAYPRVWLM